MQVNNRTKIRNGNIQNSEFQMICFGHTLFQGSIRQCPLPPHLAIQFVVPNSNLQLRSRDKIGIRSALQQSSTCTQPHSDTSKLYCTVLYHMANLEEKIRDGASISSRHRGVSMAIEEVLLDAVLRILGMTSSVQDKK